MIRSVDRAVRAGLPGPEVGHRFGDLRTDVTPRLPEVVARIRAAVER